MAGLEGAGYGHFKTEELLGQVYGPFWLPCHSAYGDATKETIVSHSATIPQCAGAAMFRATIGLSEYLPSGLLQLPRSEAVFQSAQEFYQYHKQTNEAESYFFTTPDKLFMLARREMNKLSVQPITKTQEDGSHHA